MISKERGMDTGKAKITDAIQHPVLSRVLQGRPCPIY